jgi:hypothetical protein
MDINITVTGANSIGISTNFIEIFSIFIILINALIYYFGVLWGHAQVEEYNTVSYYVGGAFFIAKYLLLPCVVILFIENYTPFYFVLSTYKPITESLLFFALSLPILVFQYIMLKCVHCINQKFERNRACVDKFEALKYKEIKPCKWILLNSVPYLTIFFLYTFFRLAVPAVIELSSFSLAFLTFTNFVSYKGYIEACYPEVKLCLKEEIIEKANILKHGNYYVHISTNDKIRLINKDDIKYIEEIKSKKLNRQDFLCKIWAKLFL